MGLHQGGPRSQTRTSIGMGDKSIEVQDFTQCLRSSHVLVVRIGPTCEQSLRHLSWSVFCRVRVGIV